MYYLIAEENSYPFLNVWPECFSSHNEYKKLSNFKETNGLFNIYSLTNIWENLSYTLWEEPEVITCRMVRGVETIYDYYYEPKSVVGT